MKILHEREMIVKIWWTTEKHQYRKDYVGPADVRHAIVTELPFLNRCTVLNTERGKELIKVSEKRGG